MPLYLVHGFKWPRVPIVMHVISNGLEAASPGWIMSSRTSEVLVTDFRKRWPRLMAELPELHFVEQYDPVANVRAETQSDFAFVADQVKECGLSVDAAMLTRIAAPKKTEDSGALAGLRDVLAKEAEIGWWIVYNGDAEREDLGSGDDEEEEVYEVYEEDMEEEGEDNEKSEVRTGTIGRKAGIK
ncbi:hypothetical protein MMC07_000359 [Pseudocyphellaria aurata]|nr:hypothetical protein [Pseudocyphellaria aurata]